MRTPSIIALALTAALFGFYLLGNEPPDPGPAASEPAQLAALSGQEPASGQAPSPAPRADAKTVAGSPAAPPDCTPTTHYGVNPDGTTTMLLGCDAGQEQRRHEYETYPSEALGDLAFADAMAAEVLGMRLRESDESASLSLIIRAAALSGGDPAPILAWSNAYPHPTSVDGVPVRKTVHTRYVLGVVAEMLGAGPNAVPYWEQQIRQVSTDPQRELDVLDERARRIIDTMRAIQVEVTGTATIGGQGDA